MESFLRPEDYQSKATPETVLAARVRDPELEANANYDAPFIAMQGSEDVLIPMELEQKIEKKRELIGRIVERLLRNVDAVCAADAPSDLKELAQSIKESASLFEHPVVSQRLAAVALQKKQEILQLCQRVYSEIRRKKTPDTLQTALNEVEDLHARLLTY